MTMTCSRKLVHQLIPPEVELGVDLGYYGIEKDYPELNVNIPVKKPERKELARQEKQ